MKIERANGVGSASAAAAYARRAQSVGARPVEEPAAAAAVMGIPENEFTPKVRDAIMALMQEVDALRRELSETRSRLETAERDADQDQLLPMLNRRAFVRELTRTLGAAARYGIEASLIYFDLDDFKAINDRLGHAAGDAVLEHFGSVLCAGVRDSDIVGRLGGDEFGIVLTHAGEQEAHQKAEWLANNLVTSPAQWGDAMVPVHFSYGAAVLKPGYDAASTIAEADAAMYAQKRQDTIKR